MLIFQNDLTETWKKTDINSRSLQYHKSANITIRFKLSKALYSFKPFNKLYRFNSFNSPIHYNNLNPLPFVIMLATKFLYAVITIVSAFIIIADAKLCRTNANLNIRASPSTKAKIVRVVTKGSNVDITCQTTGDTVDGKNTWDKLSDGTYCFDSYINNAVGLPRCDTNNGQLSNDGLNFIKQSEGFRPDFYGDSVKIKTIGYGHACHADPNHCNGIHAPITPAQGEALLRSDLASKEDCVKRYTSYNIDSNKFSALVSFCFNLGCGAYENSSLRKKLNAGDIKGAANEFLLFNRAGGKVVPGLTRRREAERNLFCKSGG
ncbi:11425_t:CDS:2 [Scutellospora calospora]|uniref:11425_t:CDS:1 n=1 Tax=Scutellospora calospora TaxID=85575 RepID=A0ACA9JZP6_9GLOM|nr:11425_t:CDS:2 [Scutellospora calospora]